MWHMAENTDKPAAAVPEKIGPWRVVRLIGRGGMADVYEVADARLGARYALKLFTYARGQESAARMRFFAEGRLLAKLAHPRLVRVYDVDEDAATGRPFFVMDLVLDPEGNTRTLADAGAAGADEEQVATWYEDLRSGLAYIHAHGILHRDLKLQNVLIGPDGHAILSDFGVAKIFDSELREAIGLTAEMTLIAAQGGKKTVMGSLGYMAPEVEMGVAASKESDWYSLGVLVFHLLTGVWCDSRTDVVGDLETFNPAWKEIVPKLLHANPAGRACPSWTEIVQRRREEEAYEAERLLEATRGKLQRAKAAKKVLVPVCAALLVALAACAGLALRFRNVRTGGGGDMTFDRVVEVPEDAPENEGISPSDEQYRLARVDAWVFLNEAFAQQARGELGVLDLASQMFTLAGQVLSGDLNEERESGFSCYVRAGEDDPLALLLYRGAERLFRRGGMAAEADKAEAAAVQILNRRKEEGN